MGVLRPSFIRNRIIGGSSGGTGDPSWTPSSVNTVTNKRITARVGSAVSSATPTINTDNYDVYKLTAQAVNITSFTINLSGTPNDNDILIIEITGTASRTIAWGSAFEGITITLPTTTVGTNLLVVGFLYNTATSKWSCMASTSGVTYQPAGDYAIACPISPSFTYTGDLLTLITYADGSTKTITYISGVITQIDFLRAGVTIRKVFNYSLGVLTSITQTTF